MDPRRRRVSRSVPVSTAHYCKTVEGAHEGTPCPQWMEVPRSTGHQDEAETSKAAVSMARPDGAQTTLAHVSDGCIARSLVPAAECEEDADEEEPRFAAARG